MSLDTYRPRQYASLDEADAARSARFNPVLHLQPCRSYADGTLKLKELPVVVQDQLPAKKKPAVRPAVDDPDKFEIVLKKDNPRCKHHFQLNGRDNLKRQRVVCVSCGTSGIRIEKRLGKK